MFLSSAFVKSMITRRNLPRVLSTVADNIREHVPSTGPFVINDVTIPEDIRLQLVTLEYKLRLWRKEM